MGQQIEIISQDVFDAVRRGYSELNDVSDGEILDYFSSVNVEEVLGHTNHVKGILFEQQYVDILSDQGIEASLFAATNHPGTDVSLFEAGEAVELQLKATDSASYVEASMLANPDTPFVVTSEVAAQIDGQMVVDSGIENAALESAVSDTLFDEAVNPLGVVSLFRLLIGLPF